MTGNHDLQPGTDGSNDFSRQVADANGVSRSHVQNQRVCVGFPSPKQQCPEPDREIGGIKVRARWASIALNRDVSARERVRDKIPNGEVLVQGQVGPHKRKTSRNGTRYLCFFRKNRAHGFSNAFSFGVNTIDIHPIGSAKIALWNVGQIFRLLAIYRSRTEEQKATCITISGEIEHSLRPVNQGCYQVRRLLYAVSCCRSRAVNDVVKLRFGNIEIPDVSLQPLDRWFAGQVRQPAQECLGASAQNGRFDIEPAFPVAVGQALEQP